MSVVVLKSYNSFIDECLFNLRMNNIEIPKLKISNKKPLASATTATLMLATCQNIVNAAQPNLKDINVETMLDPLITLLERFSFPVSIIISVIGGIMIIVGNSEGKERVKAAIVGLIIVNFIPIILRSIYYSLPH